VSRIAKRVPNWKSINENLFELIIDDSFLITCDKHFIHSIFLLIGVFGILLVGLSRVKEGEPVA